MKKGLKIFLIILALIIISSLVYLYLQRPEKVEPDVEGVQIGQAIPVKVTIAQEMPLVNYIHSEGIASSRKNWKAIAEASGTIEKIMFQNGEFVNKGELILQIKNENLKQQLVSASITYQKKYAEYLTLQQIAPKHFSQTKSDISSLVDISNNFSQFQRSLQGLLEREYENENPPDYVALKQASANLAQLFDQYEKLKLFTPFSGTIANMELKEGNFVSAGTSMFSLMKLAEMEMDVKVMETEIVRIKKDAKAFLSFVAYPEKLFEAYVRTINPSILENTGLGKIRLFFDNPGKQVAPGMFAECFIQAEKYPKLLLVPNKSIVTRDGRQIVFTKERGHSYWRYIETGKHNEFYTEILDGIAPGDSIVVQGHYTLIHDAELDVEEIIPIEEFSRYKKMK